MVYYNPHLTGEYNPLYTLTNHGIFIAQFTMELPLWRSGKNDKKQLNELVILPVTDPSYLPTWMVDFYSKCRVSLPEI